MDWDVLKEVNLDNVKWRPFYLALVNLVGILYQLPDCSCGGIAHIIVDDYNFDDHDFNFVLELCDRGPDAVEVPIVRCIVEYLRKMTKDECIVLFLMMQENYDDRDFEFEGYWDLAIEQFKEIKETHRW